MKATFVLLSYCRISPLLSKEEVGLGREGVDLIKVISTTVNKSICHLDSEEGNTCFTPRGIDEIARSPVILTGLLSF